MTDEKELPPGMTLGKWLDDHTREVLCEGVRVCESDDPEPAWRIYKAMSDRGRWDEYRAITQLLKGMKESADKAKDAKVADSIYLVLLALGARRRPLSWVKAQDGSNEED